MARTGSKAAQGMAQRTQEHGEPLLRTKLFIPPVRSERVARSGLIARLNQNRGKALILVSAPAGFGKTTLLAEWSAQAGWPVAWLSLGPEDNDPARFLRYVIAALDTALAGEQGSPCITSRAMLRSIQPLPLQAILVSFINELANVPQPFSLVLDDYQFITSSAVDQALSFILERIPPQAHLVVASRADPSFPLHRLRAAERLLELRTEDLRFTVNETDAFMNAVMGLMLTPQDVAALNGRAEGWIVGLQMAALSMQRMPDRSAFIRGFSGSHRYILEYLLEEVLNRQPQDLQAFLLQTSILDRLCAPLCDALLGEGCHSQAALETLERSNLFLAPLDQVGTWYRYHHLFADLLRARLQASQPERLPVLHLGASRWFEGAGLPEEAIQHAFAAKDLERAAQLVEQYGIGILGRGEMSSLLRLFEALPAALVRDRPALGVLHAWSQTLSGQLEKVEPQLQEIEKQVGAGISAGVRGSISIIRGLMADFRGEMASAIELAQRADQLLPQDDLTERSLIPFVLGDGYMATGDLSKAELAFEKIRSIGQASGNLWTISVALHKLALLKKLQGKLGEVSRLYEEAIQLAGESGGRQLGSMGATYVGLADLLRERNELEPARQMVLGAVQSMEHWQSPTDLVNGYVTLARISLSEGKIGPARDALERAEAASRAGRIFPITRKTLQACQVRLWLASGELSLASRWVEEAHLEERTPAADAAIDYVCEMDWITMARVLIARKEWDRSLHLLDTLAEATGASGRIGRLIEILNLRALALHGSRRTAQACDVLLKCLALAGPEGYMRTFLDEGMPMEELLQACGMRAGGSSKAYILRLLHAFKTQASPASCEGLAESLTPRESEMLHLLAAGLSNREIAERLVLSEGTVKTHAHNLYGKLGAQSRTQALARAKELKLI